jgi:hypothetical protein
METSAEELVGSNSWHAKTLLVIARRAHEDKLVLARAENRHIPAQVSQNPLESLLV